MKRQTPGPHGYWTTALMTTLNAALYLLSFGKYLWLEGRRSGRRRWHNWSHGWVHDVDPYLLPATEDEIVAAVRSQPRLRVVGAGHSFNAGVVSEATLSLDAYSGIVDVDATHKQVRVRGGTRMRDVNPLLDEHGLAIVALPSHDAQSVAGIVSTDVHGTGREVGFVSQSVAGLRIVDGLGDVHEVTPDDDLFRAAIGGIGAVGIIVEVVIQCVDSFHIRQKSERWTRVRAEAELADLMATHDHVSFYVFPFSDDVQVHTWDRTDARRSLLAVLREYFNITGQALASVWLGDLLAATKLLPRFAGAALRLQRNSSLVMRSYDGFTRTIYPLHQELEFAVPAERVWEVNDHLLAMFGEMYGRKRLPFTLFELRFTPGDHRLGLISPGAGGPPHVYVNLVCNQSGAYADFYAEAEAYIRSIGGRPHLGKWCESWSSADLARMYGADFDRFRELRRQHDPHGRFRNDFTDRVFGPIETDPPDPIFDPLEFRNLTVKNRIFRSSVGGRFDNYDGTGTPARLNWEERFAAGGVGAIISAFCPVSAQGSHMPNFATIEDDDRIPFWREVGERVHAHDCRYILQLHHCGRQRDVAGIRYAGEPAVSATGRSDALNGFPTRALRTDEIPGIVADFVAGARRAKAAGLDGVELHGANGYLLSQFLSSAINDRADRYGGSVENRARLLVEILHGIRAEVGDDWHVQVKLNAEDRNDAVFPWLPAGNDIDDAVAIARLAAAAGADAIHVSSGSSFPHPDNPPGEFPLGQLKRTYDGMISEGKRTFFNYVLLRYRVTRWIYSLIWGRTQTPAFEGALAPLAATIRDSVDVPVIVTGGFQQAHLIRSVLELGQADAVSIARPLVANPDLVRSFEQGRNEPERPCSFCNRCLVNMIEHPMGCYDLDRFDGDATRMFDEVMAVFRPRT